MGAFGRSRAVFIPAVPRFMPAALTMRGPMAYRVGHVGCRFYPPIRLRAGTPPGLNPGWLQFKVVMGVALLSALLLLRQTRNTFVELGRDHLRGHHLLFLFNAAAAWRQNWVPRWLAQLVALMLGAVLAPLVVQLLGTGGDIATFTHSRAHVGGYFMVMFGARRGHWSAVGQLSGTGERARAEALQFALERETLQRQATDAAAVTHGPD